MPTWNKKLNTPGSKKLKQNNTTMRSGTVYLVGAGPGDPKLLTIAGLEALRRAQVLVFDALANPVLLDLAPPEALRIDAGKRAKQHTLTQDQTQQLLAEHALAGRTVVRLKGGDPYVFGRGSEEAIYLHERGVPVVVIPGITAAIAAPAYAGIPVTHRQIATTCTLVTGHEDPTKDQGQVEFGPLAQLAKRGGTLCFYMGMGRLQAIAAGLMGEGLSGDTPAAVIQWGTRDKQRCVRGSLSQLHGKATAAGLGAPAIIIVGQVAGIDDAALNWFMRRPLFGQTIVVTRTRQQASELRERLEELGAHVIETPTIALEKPTPEQWAGVLDAVRRVRDYAWLILTSVNGVEGLRRALAELKVDARALAGVRIAAIGEATAAATREQLGVAADFVPTAFVAESLAGELLAQHDLKGKRVLMLRADIARPALVELLDKAGATVEDRTIYRTVAPADVSDELMEALGEKRVDWITFTSSSTAKNLVEMLGPRKDLLAGVKTASIGPITSATLRELGLDVAMEAEVHDIDGLVAGLLKTVEGGGN
ncbi:MAG: uroporphyrinogen-III C-methyltransferase [Phycisphaerales bacterium]